MKRAYEKGTQDLVEYATNRFYELVCINCASHEIDAGEIHYEFDKNTKTGRVYTSDKVVIFNEFGTGIKGTQDEWANEHSYIVNASGKGESGWWYPSDEEDPNPYKWTDPSGQIRALTHGLESRHMFYDAMVQLQNEFPDMVEITFGKALGELY